MDKYKADFEEEYKEKWTFQDEFTEERYKQFKEELDNEADGFSGRLLSSTEIDDINRRLERTKLEESAVLTIN